MAYSHRYRKEHWVDYYYDNIDEDVRLEMTLHLSECNECLDQYAECAWENMSCAPEKIKNEIIKMVKKPNSPKQVMFAYITAACIALCFYSLGIFDKTIDYAPKSIEQSLDAITKVTNNMNKITNNFIWRDIYEKEK